MNFIATMLFIASILCALEVIFTIVILCQLLPKKEEEKPVNKFPYTNITLQFESDDAIYTLYDDYSWEVDVKY